VFLERLRERWRAKRDEHAEKEAEELEAEARGEAYGTRAHNEAVRDERYEEDFPSRGGGIVGR